MEVQIQMIKANKECRIGESGKVGGLGRIGESGKVGGLGKIVKSELRTALLVVVAFLLSRVFLPGEILPLGYAFFAASLDYRVNSLAVGVATCVGALSTGFNPRSVIIILSVLLLVVVNIFLPVKKKRGPVYSALFALACNIAASIFVIYINGFLLYDLLIALVQCIVAVIGYFIFTNVMEFFTEQAGDKILTPEELSCCAITIILCVSGLPGISLFGFQLKNILSVLLLILFSYKGGFGVGAAVGLIVGMLVRLPSNEVYGLATSMAVYAFCGFLAGLLNKFGKIGPIVGFVLGNASLAILLNGSTEVLLPLKDISLAGFIFFLIPTKVFDFIKVPESNSFDGVIVKANYSDEIKRSTVNKLNGYSESIFELAKTFEDISDKEASPNKERILTMLDRVAGRVCVGCGMKDHCWGRSFYETYRIMFKLIEKLDNKGRLRSEDVPGYFSNRCDRVDSLISELGIVYEMYKVEVLWSKKLAESRSIYAEQLFALSRLIKGFALEVDVDLKFMKSSENAILVELNKAGYRANAVTVFENKWNKYEVTLDYKGCGGRRECVSILSGLISQVLGRKMVVGDSAKSTGKVCENGGTCNYVANLKKCKVRFIEEEKLRVMPGVSEESKDYGKVSGDSFSLMNYGDGKYIAAICDGMGTGKNASKQSRAAIGLLEQFIESGFDKESAIKMINSIFVMKSDKEIFSTIDLAIIDLHSGKTEFIKHGSMPTVIKRGGGINPSIEIINSNKLPIGIVNNMESSLIKSQIFDGDFIVMMSDGILDCFRIAGKKQDDIVRFIEECNTQNPQEMADMILDEAKAILPVRQERVSNGYDAGEKYTTEVPDDMLVLVLKVWEKIN